MSKKIEFLQRWMFIIDKIASHPYITMQQLLEAVENELPSYDGVEKINPTLRTILRDLNEIRNSPYMDISIEYCRVNKGYYIPKDEKSISKLERLFELSSLLSFSQLKDIVFPENRQFRGLEHRHKLILAIKKSVEVWVDYSKFDHSPVSKTPRRLQPYALKEFKSRWYLLAREVDRPSGNDEDIKIWGLDRIEKLTLTNRTFKKDAKLNVQKVFEHCFGIYSNKDIKAERVVLSFSPLSGRYNDSLPLHESQKTLIKNEKEYRIELTVKITQDFIMELLSQSEGMKVIEPVSLRERLIDIHLKAISLLRE